MPAVCLCFATDFFLLLCESGCIQVDVVLFLESGNLDIPRQMECCIRLSIAYYQGFTKRWKRLALFSFPINNNTAAIVRRDPMHYLQSISLGQPQGRLPCVNLGWVPDSTCTPPSLATQTMFASPKTRTDVGSQNRHVSISSYNLPASQRNCGLQQRRQGNAFSIHSRH